MSRTGQRVLIVGASMAGVRALEGLRWQGFSGEVIVVGDEAHFPPYDRPPLSKQVLSGAWPVEQARVRLPDDLAVQLRLRCAALAADVAARQLTLDDGVSLTYDGLVVATGVRPRLHPCIDPRLRGVHVLRTLDDALQLREALAPRPEVVLVGAGFVGMEVAATARQAGCGVTVVEPTTGPMTRALGPEMAEVVAALHREHGVRQRYGRKVVGIEEVTGHLEVVLDDGCRVAAGAVVVAIGAESCTAWLQGSGLKVEDGVVCDARLFVEGADDVVAAGDVARWYDPRLGAHHRVEHWSNASAQGLLAGRNLARRLAGCGDDEEEYSEVPYFWTEQYDWKFQLVGSPSGAAQVIEGSVDSGKFVAAYGDPDRPNGALCVNWPARLASSRRRLVGST